MRKYLLPGAVCAAIAAIVLLLLGRGGEPERPERDTPAPEAPPPPAARNGIGAPAVTPTPLDENRYLRELERALARDDLSNAHFYRQKVCEEIESVLASEKHTRNLLDAIRKHGIDSDDPRRRDVVLPMLRVVAHPEATRMIADEYYQTQSEAERMTLLEAMSHPYHDPRMASVWAVERALQAPTEEDRERAFDLIRHYAVDEELIATTGIQIYESSTDPKQQAQVLQAISERGRESASARDFIRKRLRSPRAEDLMIVTASIANWGEDDDAARLEALAEEFPAFRDPLREAAKMTRRARRIERLGPGVAEREEADSRAQAEEERRRQAEESPQEPEREGGGG